MKVISLHTKRHCQIKLMKMIPFMNINYNEYWKKMGESPMKIVFF